jgi:hypothetical protein
VASDPPRKPEQDRRGSSDPGLTRHYLWLLLLIGLPLVMLVILLAVNEYRNQRIRVLNDMTQASASATMGLQTIARLANEHVLRLRDWTSDYFSDRRERPSRLRPYLTPRFKAGQPDGFTLDQIPGEQRSPGRPAILVRQRPLGYPGAESPSRSGTRPVRPGQVYPYPQLILPMVVFLFRGQGLREHVSMGQERRCHRGTGPFLLEDVHPRVV